MRSLSLHPSAATVVLQQHRQQSPGRPWQHPHHPGLLHKQLRRTHHAGRVEIVITRSSRTSVYLRKITVQLDGADYRLISTLFLTKDCLFVFVSAHFLSAKAKARSKALQAEQAWPFPNSRRRLRGCEESAGSDPGHWYDKRKLSQNLEERQ